MVFPELESKFISKAFETLLYEVCGFKYLKVEIKMKRTNIHVKLCMAMVCLMLLSGCVSREQADQRLAEGCAMGAGLFLEEEAEVLEIKEINAVKDTSMNAEFRRIDMVVLEGDDWYSEDKEYSCVFSETYALFGLTHTAEIIQLRMGDEIHGQDGRKIMGEINDYLRLKDTVDTFLN